MNKAMVLCFLLLTAFASIALSWVLFPWAQSISAVELVDGTKAIVSPTAGTWIIKLGLLVSGLSFVAFLWVAVFYKAKKAE